MNTGGEETLNSSIVPVSVVVCARNEARRIARCLQSVLAARPAEVVVVDDQSTDGTAEIARQHGITVVPHVGRGLGDARRLGAEHTSQDVVVFVDADATLRPDTLEALLREADELRYDALQARVDSLPGRLTYWQTGENWRRRAQERPGRAHMLTCQATLVRRDLLLRVGFDPVFNGAAEDNDFFFRAAAEGAILGHSARALAYHEDRATLREFLRQRFWYGKGMAMLIVRHHALAPQVKSAGRALNRDHRYIPFMMVSWGAMALGMSAEFAVLVFDAGLRGRLRKKPLTVRRDH